jgi:xanthine dehydrogenase accessory factor
MAPTLRTAQQSAATVLEWLREGRRVAAGTLVGIDGSAPLDVGASMYVDADGVIEGSVTGGCVESASPRRRKPSSTGTARRAS